MDMTRHLLHLKELESFKTPESLVLGHGVTAKTNSHRKEREGNIKIHHKQAVTNTPLVYRFAWRGHIQLNCGNRECKTTLLPRVKPRKDVYAYNRTSSKRGISKRGRVP